MNLLLQSNNFNNTWINQLGGGTITGGQINALSESDDAWKLTKDAASSRSIRQAISLSSSTYAYSAFLKSGTLANAAMRVDTSSGARIMNLDLSIGTISSTSGTLVSTSIEDYGNGWYRCTMVVTESITNVHVYVGEFSGTIAGDIYCQRTQLEALPYATSYIPTVASTVTRVAETASKTGLSSYINSSEGVLFVEMEALANDNTERVINLSDGTANNRILISFGATSNELRFRFVSSGTEQALITTTSYNALNFNKVAISYKFNEVKVYVNGSIIGTDISVNVPIANTFNKINFKNEFGGGTFPFFGKVKNLQVYPTALSDAQLIALTQ
jgi:hypothetical protein